MKIKKIVVILTLSLLFQEIIPVAGKTATEEPSLQFQDQEITAEEIQTDQQFSSDTSNQEDILEFSDSDCPIVEGQYNDEIEVQAATAGDEGDFSLKVRQVYENVGMNLADSAAKYTPQLGSINGEWEILGLSRSGQEVDPSVYSKYKENVVNTVLECGGILHKKKYSEYSRVVLALTSLGEDVTDVAGYNLMQPLSDFDQTVWQGINGAIWALIAFDSHNYEIPKAEAGKTQNTREKLIDHILSMEISSGGWAMSGNKADPDITGMAVQALASYYDTNTKVKQAVDRAVDQMSAIQNEDGGYSSWGQENSESCSQVIVALTALGINPALDKRFQKNGRSVLHALLEYVTDDYAFAHIKGNEADQMATEQGFYALTAYFRFLDGKTSLYDMSDVKINGQMDRETGTKTEASDNTGTSETVKPGGHTVTIKPTQVEENKNSDMKEEQQEFGSDEQSDISNTSGKYTSGSSKVTGGTTKTVNMVFSGRRTGSTSIYPSSDDKLSAESKEQESEQESDHESEKEIDKEELTEEKAKSLISDIRYLLQPDKKEEKLPQLPKDYSDEQLASILDIYRGYEKLTKEQKDILKQDGLFKKYEEILQKLEKENHYDRATGTDMRDNDEKVLPWYVKLEVSSNVSGDSCLDKIKETLNGRGEVLAFCDIHLSDLLNGGEYRPQDLLRVSIPILDTGKYENTVIVHAGNEETVEFLDTYKSGNYLEFDTDEFSVFAIAGYDGSLEDIMEGTQEKTAWIYFIPGGSAALLLLLLAGIRIISSQKRRKREG